MSQEKHTFDELNQEVARYRAMLDAVPDFIFRIDKEGNYLDFRAPRPEQLALPPDVIVGSNIRDLSLSPDMVQRAFTAIEAALETGEVQVFEYSLEMPDGWHEYEARLLACAPDEVIAIVRDVTERVRTEEALLVSQRRYSLATASAHVGVWDWNLETGEFYLDPNIKRILGYEDDEIPNDLEEWSKHIHPDDKQAVMAAANEAVEGRTSEYVYEHRMMHKDGTVRWVLARGSVIRNADGEVIRMVGTDTDITERRQAEEELRRHEVVLETIFDHLPVMVVLVDAEGRGVIANKAVKRTLGWPLEDLDESGVLARLYPDADYRGEFLDHMKAARSEWRDFKTRVASGRNLDVSWACVPLPDGRRIVIGQDISDRVEAEREREHLETQLRQRQKMEALGTLAGGIAHDLNNILLAITGFAELALYDVDRGARDQKEDLEQILTAARRAGQLVERILSFSRPRRPQVKAVDACRVVRGAMDLLRASIPSNIEFEERLDPSAGRIRADENQIQQLILNLGSNAAYAMGDSSGRLTVAVSGLEVDEQLSRKLGGIAQGRFVKLTVTDTGQGMDEKTLKRIYDPFFTTKRVGEGTGLGLSVVHGIVQSHGGSIQVRSQVGVGTTFDVYLPAVEAVAEPVQAADVIYSGRERVLLVDDEPQVARVGQLQLERLGYEVVTCTESPAALELFQAEPGAFDMLVTDQTMPQMSGLALAREIKEIRPELPMVLTTGYAPMIADEALEDLDIFAVLRKPYPGQALARAVRQALDQSVSQAG